jgi:hypothetical protein
MFLVSEDGFRSLPLACAFVVFAGGFCSLPLAFPDPDALEIEEVVPAVELGFTAVLPPSPRASSSESLSPIPGFPINNTLFSSLLL